MNRRSANLFGPLWGAVGGCAGTCAVAAYGRWAGRVCAVFSAFFSVNRSSKRVRDRYNFSLVRSLRAMFEGGDARAAA
jgi:hypothetical protein